MQQYTPKNIDAVRDFVDRWEAEVLQPTFAAIKIAEKASVRKKKAGAA